MAYNRYQPGGWIFGADRMGRVKTMSPEENHIHGLLLFSLGSGIYASKVSFIREVVSDQVKIPLPGAPDYIPGVITIRSDVVKVIDIRRIIPLDRDSEKKRVIVFLPHGKDGTRFGMVVDDVYGIIEVPGDAITFLDQSDNHIQTNFMIGFFKTSLDGFLSQSGRKYMAGTDDVVWIDFEDLIQTITNDDKADDIVFRLTALFNPGLLLSGEWKGKEKTGMV